MPRKSFKLRFLALILTVLSALTLLGCTSGELGDALEFAGEIIDVVDELVGESSSGQADVTDSTSAVPPDKPSETTQAQVLDEDGHYSSKEDVALYIHLYGKLPSNFMSKSEARKLGWEGGSLEDFAPGCQIGGDRFGNYEKLLPTKKGRAYTECDIDTLGKSSRGAKRIVFSNDGLVYYTDDHYESFELLYGEE